MEEEITDKPQQAHSGKMIGWMVVFLLIAVGVSIYLYRNAPKAEKEEIVIRYPAVKIVKVKKSDAQVHITTQGVVESLREVSLAAEISGRVRELSPQWKKGGIVKEGDVLLEIDDSDILALKARAESAVATAKETLAQEEAQALMARREWERIGKGEASALTLREPQVARARALLSSAEADLTKNAKDLERCIIRAPFSGRVRTANIEVGAVLMPGMALGQLYSDTELQLRMPLNMEDAGMITNGAPVTLKGSYGGKEKEWKGEVTKLDGEVERRTHSAHVFVKILSQAENPPVGMFLHASLPGIKIPNVVTVSRDAIYEGTQVLIADAKDMLEIRDVTITRAEKNEVWISQGLSVDERIIITPVPAPLKGMKLAVSEN